MTQQRTPDEPDPIQREIEDILRRKRFGEGATPRPRPAAVPRPGGGGLGRLRPKSPKQVLIAGGLLLLLYFFGLTRLLRLGDLPLWIGLFVLAFGFLTFLIRPTSTNRYWRGERIELPEDRAWTARLYRFIYGG